MFRRKVEHYRVARKCKACSHTHFYWDTERNLRALISRPAETCHCSTYYTHPHRPGAKFCDANPDQEFNLRVYWMGEKASEVRVEMGMSGRGGIVSHEPPF